MYKLLLCWRYLRTRWIALASVVSVTLGVATMIVVNSVMEGFRNEALGDFGAVGVGGVDESDAESDGAAEDAAGFVRIAGLAPSAIAYKAHGAVTKAVYRQIAADEKCPARGGCWCSHYR